MNPETPSDAEHATPPAGSAPGAAHRATWRRATDPFPKLAEFRARITSVWIWTGLIVVGMLGALLLSSAGQDGQGFAAFANHLYSHDAWPISLAQYALLAIAIVLALRLSFFLEREYGQIDQLLLRWAEEEFPVLGNADVSGPVARIRAQVANAIHGAGTLDRAGLLEEFDGEFERRHAPLRHLAGVAIFFGLLGTFWGLQGHAANLQAANGLDRVGQIAQAMHTAFACSIAGVLSALILGFVSLRLHVVSVMLRQRLEHVLATRILPQAAAGDITSPLVHVLEKVDQAIRQLGRMGSAVGEMPELVRQMQSSFAGWSVANAGTAGALNGLEAAVRGLDQLNGTFHDASSTLAGAATGVQGQITALTTAVDSYRAHVAKLESTVSALDEKLQGVAEDVERVADASQERLEALLHEGRDLLRAELEELGKAETAAREARRAEQEATSRAVREDAAKAIDAAVERLAQHVLDSQRAAMQHHAEQVRVLGEIRDRVGKGGGRGPRRPRPVPQPPDGPGAEPPHGDGDGDGHAGASSAWYERLWPWGR